jgi:hypothetical protein
MRVVVSAIVGAVLGFILPMALCVAAAMIVGGPDSTGQSTADAILAIGPILALVGMFVGDFLGIARARKRVAAEMNRTNE